MLKVLKLAKVCPCCKLAECALPPQSCEATHHYRTAGLGIVVGVRCSRCQRPGSIFWPKDFGVSGLRCRGCGHRNIMRVGQLSPRHRALLAELPPF